MKARVLWRVVVPLLFLLLILMAVLAMPISKGSAAKSHNPDLEYLKAVNSIAPPKDPQLLFLLMTEFANSNPQEDGANLFSARLTEFEPQLAPVQKSLYLGIIGLLRAQHASSVPLLSRYRYVKDTIAALDQAKQLSGGQVFVVNWIAGVVHTELPGYFHQRQAAQEELSWCVEHADKAPHPGWLREVYHHLGKLALNDGNKGKALEICGAAATPTSITPSRWQRPFPRTEPPVMRLRQGALQKSFLVASMHCPVSSLRNTTS
jgi:hypothetical protein